MALRRTAEAGICPLLGIRKDRYYGGIEEWAGEEAFCGSWRALRFKALETQKYRDATPSSRFRRFFHDGNVVARVEAGVRYERLFFARKLMRAKEVHFLPHEWLDVTRHASALPVAIKMGNRPVGESALCAAGQFLSYLYLYATTEKEQSVSSDLADWWIDAGTPMLLASDDYWPEPTASWGKPTACKPSPTSSRKAFISASRC